MGQAGEEPRGPVLPGVSGGGTEGAAYEQWGLRPKEPWPENPLEESIQKQVWGLMRGRAAVQEAAKKDIRDPLPWLLKIRCVHTLLLAWSGAPAQGTKGN